MKISTTMLVSALVAGISAGDVNPHYPDHRPVSNPWTTCNKWSKPKCDLHGEDNPGVTFADFHELREYWLERALWELREQYVNDQGESVSSNGPNFADPKKDDPKAAMASAEEFHAGDKGDDCSNGVGGGQIKGDPWAKANGWDSGHARVKVCQDHGSAIFDTKWVPDACVSNYIDIIWNECHDKGKEGYINGQVRIDSWGVVLRVTDDS